MSTEKTECRTPNGGSSTNIPTWKFDAVRTAILKTLDDYGDEGLFFSDLSGEVKKRLSSEDLERLGSVGWHTTSVKLELEVRGEISRVAGKSPQRLFRNRKR